MLLFELWTKGGLQWIYGQPFRLPTYPMRPPHLPTADICDLDDSPPNSLLKNKSLKPEQPRLSLPPPSAFAGWWGWCWAKRSLTRLMQGLELCPWFSPDGAGVWSQQGLQDGAALAVAAFRVYAPPRPGCRFSRSSGATSAGSRSSGLRQQGRAGQLQGVKS